jgi:hypothetical protein
MQQPCEMRAKIPSQTSAKRAEKTSFFSNLAFERAPFCKAHRFSIFRVEPGSLDVSQT